MLGTNSDKPALPRQWIVPIRLAIYIVLAGCAAYIFFNVRDLEITHLFIFLPIALVAGMAALDCKMSEKYWQEQDKKPVAEKQDSED